MASSIVSGGKGPDPSAVIQTAMKERDAGRSDAAILQVKAIFCALLHRYRFELVDAPETYRDIMPSLILRPSEPCRLRYCRRQA